jgi:exopolysaccharide biosynthesis polyprenyl glycosylphosphotransferase
MAERHIGAVGPMALVQESAQHAELSAVLDERTQDILRRRRSSANPHNRHWLVRRALILADVVGLVGAFAVAEAAFEPLKATDRVSLSTEAILFLISLPVWICIANLYGLYGRDEERTSHTTTDDTVGIFHVVTLGVWGFFLVTWVSGLGDSALPKLALFWVLAVPFVALARSLARGLSRRRLAYLQNALIVGAGDIGQLVARKFLQHPEYGVNVVGFVDDDPKERREDIRHVAVLGPPEQLPALVELFDIERVIVAFSPASHQETLELIHEVRDLDVQVDVIPRLFEAIGPKMAFHDVEGLPLVGLSRPRRTVAARFGKRCLDLVVATIALVLTAPIFALTAIRIKRDSPGPVFFRQQRLGADMRPFTVLKFRTMDVDSDPGAHREYIGKTMDPRVVANGNGLYKLDNDQRVTKVGRWLRRTSLDELPQLINVVRGEMSLVGPRPCIEYETQYFAPHHFDRFLVKPGLTGLWQVTARARSTFGEALDMDVAYVRSWTLGLDLRLLCRTPLQVLTHKGTV